MFKKIEYVVESFIFNSRWLLAPFFIGLIACIAILLVKFTQELIHLFPTLLTTNDSTIIVSVLTLVDMTLVASLLLMIIFSGYEIFVSKIDSAEHKDRPNWMGTVDFSGLKLRVIGSIVAISAIELLKAFVYISDKLKVADISPETIALVNQELIWKLAIHLTFVISGVLFALMDRLSVIRAEIEVKAKKK